MNGNTPGRTDPRQPPLESKIPELAALDPTADPDRFDPVVGRIMEAVEPELARRREAADPLVSVSSWWRPVVPVAATIVLVSAGLLLSFDHRSGERGDPGEERTIQTELATALGVPDAISGWIDDGELPDPGEVVLTLDAER